MKNYTNIYTVLHTAHNSNFYKKKLFSNICVPTLFNTKKKKFVKEKICVSINTLIKIRSIGCHFLKLTKDVNFNSTCQNIVRKPLG